VLPPKGNIRIVLRNFSNEPVAMAICTSKNYLLSDIIRERDRNCGTLSRKTPLIVYTNYYPLSELEHLESVDIALSYQNSDREIQVHIISKVTRLM
jgi:hypothetical protein